jgi:hypothetical protein
VGGARGRRDDRALDFDRAASGGYGRDDQRGNVVDADGDAASGGARAATPKQGGSAARSAAAGQAQHLGHQTQGTNGRRDGRELT